MVEWLGASIIDGRLQTEQQVQWTHRYCASQARCQTRSSRSSRPAMPIRDIRIQSITLVDPHSPAPWPCFPLTQTQAIDDGSSWQSAPHAWVVHSNSSPRRRRSVRYHVCQYDNIGSRQLYSHHSRPRASCRDLVLEVVRKVLGLPDHGERPRSPCREPSPNGDRDLWPERHSHYMQPAETHHFHHFAAPIHSPERLPGEYEVTLRMSGDALATALGAVVSGQAAGGGASAQGSPPRGPVAGGLVRERIPGSPSRAFSASSSTSASRRAEVGAEES